jgi:hypothetical protein
MRLNNCELGIELNQRHYSMKPYNQNIHDTLDLSQELMSIADKGDMEREDDGCGVLYGIVRDAAYRIKTEAEREIDCHRKKGKWEDH